jgi:hypothetical protein
MKKIIEKLTSLFSKKKDKGFGEVTDMAEWFAGLNDEKRARFMHTAGIKTASTDMQKKWLNDRIKKEEEQKNQFIKKMMNAKPIVKPTNIDTTFSDATMGYTATELRSGIDINNLEQRLKRERKQAEKDFQLKKDIDFQSLPFSRITNETKAKIIELVREDIKNQADITSKLFPEPELSDNDKFVMSLFDEKNDVIVKKSKTKK